MQRCFSMWHSPTYKIALVQSPTINQRYTLSRLTLCMLGNFSCFFVIWFIFFEKFFQHISECHVVEPRSGQTFCPTWSWTKLLQMLSADDISRQRRKIGVVFGKMNSQQRDSLTQSASQFSCCVSQKKRAKIAMIITRVCGQTRGGGGGDRGSGPPLEKSQKYRVS